jgi:phasin family protein
MEDLSQRYYDTGKSNLDLATRFAVASLEGAQRLVKLQTDAASEAFSESWEKLQTLIERPDLATFSDLYKNSMKRLLETTQESFEILSKTQTELSEILGEQFTAMTRGLEQTRQATSRAAQATLRSLSSIQEEAGDQAVKAVKQARRSI